MGKHVHDLLVIGGGPAGAATAFWAASAGLDTVFVEKKTFPREKTCGDGIPPRGVHQLIEMEEDLLLLEVALTQKIQDHVKV